ncbi:hypothetical protein FA15DRAFT_622233 [Coprinopsis marcescibilis]|uniref:Uncharacterized protein n=1 Tax=Coprinopsis marcescibilis TaxID=230819 RepID=A0A5C3KPV7_COPMA|nr:hypothetical protein FA15DRAFT_622233 [Coprinopsis marcescibilis]
MSSKSSPPSVLVHDATQLGLPLELVEALNQAYFLHLLATHPDHVVPPGKSLLSMLLHSQMNSGEGQDKAKPLLERVKEVAHKAFWDEAAESLSNPSPAVQLPRLQQIYQDIYDVLNPLFPPGHRVILTLRSPLAPTSSPLQSTLVFMQELLLALRRRCAPVRDELINEQYRKLDAWYDPPTNDHQSSDSARSRLALLLVDTFRNIIRLAPIMKSDLNTILLGSMSEEQIKTLVFRQAKDRERELVLKIWTGREDGSGEQVLWEVWDHWVSMLPESEKDSFGPCARERRWTARLMLALGSDSAVSCTKPSLMSHPPEDQNSQPNSQHEQRGMEMNELPPQFFFSSRRLFFLQNYVQAIAIAAALRILAGYSAAAANSHGSPSATFTTRIWTLLKLEIEAEETGKERPDEATKLINLADEVVHARRLASSTKTIDTGEEESVRRAVDRTLRPDDPVFILLRRRLLVGLGKQLVAKFDLPSFNRIEQIPNVMKTGRAHTNDKTVPRPRVIVPDEDTASAPRFGVSEVSPSSFVIRGFEDPVLVDANYELFIGILECMQWGATVWNVPSGAV